MLLVVAGVSLASLPPSGLGAAATPSLVGPDNLKHIALCIVSFAFPSLSVIIKERIFKEAKEKLGGRDLDVLVVNAFGSTAQVMYDLASRRSNLSSGMIKNRVDWDNIQSGRLW